MGNKPNKISKDRDNIVSIWDPHAPKENLMQVTKEGREGIGEGARWFGVSLSC